MCSPRLPPQLAAGPLTSAPGSWLATSGMLHDHALTKVHRHGAPSPHPAIMEPLDRQLSAATVHSVPVVCLPLHSNA
jgi:hypothetical protein